MICPYCQNEMKDGNIHATNSVPYWLAEGGKRELGDVVCGKGLLPVKKTFAQHLIPCAYCPACKKLIIDAALQD